MVGGKMKHKTIDGLEENGKKGDWCFRNRFDLIVIQYGDNRIDEVVMLPISENPPQGSRFWKWNGDKEKPTLSPSILVYPREGFSKGWHGYLRDGELVEA
jgi:hypothetical protein